MPSSRILPPRPRPSCSRISASWGRYPRARPCRLSPAASRLILRRLCSAGIGQRPASAAGPSYSWGTADVSSVVKVLVLGGSGMLGHAAYRCFAAAPGVEAYATLRGDSARRHFSPELQPGLVPGVDALDSDGLTAVLARLRPEAVVNCIGIVKQLSQSRDPLVTLPVNALFPHRLARLCALLGARLVHISTDCVFRGSRGGYTEQDPADPDDLYGRSKLLGEVDAPHRRDAGRCALPGGPSPAGSSQ